MLNTLNMLFYDTESCFLKRGYKRKDTQLFEIGMVHGRKTFQCMVNPVGNKPPMATLDALGQHPVKSIRFWTKLLQKRIPQHRRQKVTPEEQSKRIAKIVGEFPSPEEAVRRAYDFGKGKYGSHTTEKPSTKKLSVDISHASTFPTTFISKTRSTSCANSSTYPPTPNPKSTKPSSNAPTWHTTPSKTPKRSNAYAEKQASSRFSH